MYIILKQNEKRKRVINIFHKQSLDIVRNWIWKKMLIDLQSLNYCPVSKNIKDVSYEIIDSENTLELVKRYKKTKNGYIYNSSIKNIDVLYTISILEYNNVNNVNEH